MVSAKKKNDSQQTDAVRIGWGWIYVWFVLVFAAILAYTTMSVQYKRLCMDMDGLIQKKLSLSKTLSDTRGEYYKQLTFESVENRVEQFHLELAPAAIPAIALKPMDTDEEKETGD
jgi:hypothetical protein